MKMAKKVLAVLLAVLFVAGCFAGCADKNSGEAKSGSNTSENAKTGDVDFSDVKVGFIFLHDENSTYDLNFIKAADAACEALGISEKNKIYKTNIPEGQECLEAANDLVDSGCTIVFADSFGHEDYLIEAAKAHPEVQFCHSTGTKAHTEGLDNYHNAFASIYEGRRNRLVSLSRPANLGLVP